MGPTQTATSGLLLLACEVAGPNAIQRCREAPDRIHLRALEAGPPWPCPPRRGPVRDIGLLWRCSWHLKSHATEGHICTSSLRSRKRTGRTWSASPTGSSQQSLRRSPTEASLSSSMRGGSTPSDHNKLTTIAGQGSAAIDLQTQFGCVCPGNGMHQA